MPHRQIKYKFEAITSALDDGFLQHVSDLLNSLHPSEIAHLLESIPHAKRQLVWRLIQKNIEGDVLVYVNDEVRVGLIEDMSNTQLIALTEGLEVDDLADIISDLPKSVSQSVLQSMDKLHRHRLQAVMLYPEDTAGGLMNVDTITVRSDVSLNVVFRYLRIMHEIPESTDGIIVIDRKGFFVGLLTLSKLLTSAPGLIVADVMTKQAVIIKANQPDYEVANLFEHHDLVSAPVVDDDNRLLGRITIDDVVDIIRDEAESSLRNMVGLDEEEDMFSPVIKSSRKRALWLGVNLFTAFLASWVIGLFEGSLEKIVALAVLMPIVASMGGVAGGQTLTLIIRGIALGQVLHSNAQRLLVRELMISFLNGLLWAMVVAIITIFWFHDYRIGLVIAAALVINMVVAAASGVLVPIILDKIGFPPALAGPVILTTITDVVGFLSFLGLASIFLF
ncbi:MAG: magnesium transporter [Methylococcales bacterium]|nr:magnesium transporter [Methylococcales bacterium]MBT7409838.1 magnesium transporter [Methylococcales bacterium]